MVGPLHTVISGADTRMVIERHLVGVVVADEVLGLELPRWLT